MIGAIVQAIDHAMQRAHDGAGAGIKVANSQHGGGAPISNMDSGAGEAAKQDLGNQQETTSKQDEAAEKAKIGSNSTPAVAESAGEQVGKGAEAIKGAGASEGVGAATEGASASEGVGAGAEGIAGAASSILSDENAKTSKPVSKLQLVRAYGANAGKGFANAGAIATGGSKAAKWENIDNSFARKAAEDTVKGWRKRDFNKQGEK